MTNKSFIFINNKNKKLSGGNIYNSNISNFLIKLGYDVQNTSNLYDVDTLNKSTIYILDSIVIDETFDISIYKNTNSYFLIHLWPSYNTDFDKGKRNRILQKQVEICENFPLIFAGEHAYIQTKEFFVKKLKYYTIIPPGVQANWKKKIQYNRTAKHFLLVGNICKRKRQLEILQAFNSNRNLKLTLVGRSDDLGYREEINNYISLNKLDVLIIDEVNHNEMNILMIQHDALLLFSEEENNSMAIIEGIATGLPFISTPTGEYRNYLKNKIGIVTTDYTIERFEEAILNISKNEQIYRKQIQQIQNAVINYWEDSAKMFAQL
ncbi:MAG: hypothetical protein RLZZ546_1894 [Bacteroidota bacterium]|jgi:glycosyltransferase involved in cell wall biosynthesis